MSKTKECPMCCEDFIYNPSSDEQSLCEECLNDLYEDEKEEE